MLSAPRNIQYNASAASVDSAAPGTGASAPGRELVVSFRVIVRTLVSCEALAIIRVLCRESSPVLDCSSYVRGCACICVGLGSYGMFECTYTDAEVIRTSE